ncbi:hypothetical protein JRI60_19765 [Archangium violaceum]|uniref:hypothetical protein n=1 Tax=Archangium violaceum TaxID=83451 RepID=UPI00194F5194|nr:hypothetical protein [Archangium violaceum]QRO01110.1 hypothetical protein JRI60_19765 [Archangium violaceum]
MKLRRGGLFAVSLVASTLVACAHTPVGYRMPGEDKEGVVVVTEHDAVKTKLPAWSASMPLVEEGEDASVLKFLAQADASGAKYLSGVDLVFLAEDAGSPMECRTHFLPVVAVETKRVIRENFPKYASRQVSAGPSGGANRLPVPVQVNNTKTNQYVYVHMTDVPHYDEQLTVKRWRLLKSDPECKALESGPDKSIERVEGRAYGCDASACEDKSL